MGGVETSWIVRLTLNQDVQVSSPGWGHCVVFLGKTLQSHTLSTQVYKWVPVNLILGRNSLGQSRNTVS